MFRLSNRNALLLLGAVVLIAFALRLYRAGTYGIYFDEKSTLLISQGVVLEGANQKDVFSKPYFTPAEFWKPKTFADFIDANIRGDIGNSPAYYGVLYVWIKLFGMSDWAIRMPSVLFSTLTVLLLFIFVRRHFRSERLALLSAFIAAIEPFFVAYSHMARNYSMTFFLTLLATHIFLLIIENLDNRKQPTGLYIAYGLTFVTSVLSHYLTVTVFLCHGLYALLYLRNVRAWVTLGITGALGLGLVSLWFIFGGGKYTFFTLNYQAQFYRNIALTNPTGTPFGLILPATIPNITVRAIPIFADLFIFTNGLGKALLGIRNSLVALGAGALATLIIHQYGAVKHPSVWVRVAVAVLMAAGLLYYTVVPFRFLVLSAAVPFVYLIGRYVVDQTDNREKRLVVMLALLTFVPTFFLLFMAWRSGHTFGITQRYSGFSFPYVCILVAMGLRQLSTLPWWFSAPLAATLLLQLGFIVQLLIEIYADAQPKYTYFDRPRIANPYWASAQQLKTLYAPGDTILYPNLKRPIYSEKIDKTYSPVGLLDAQLVNVYLPENAQFIQRVDPAEPNRIVLVKGKTGQKITIFDFEGTKFRY
ncbi:phospholipid carrier-dependent glycosyltransferase [Fibrisoma montanum]|uniref:Phospholipid carrier-dependent glycosyltransferase n=1 Tax=Fibrisoma montanum TaxID=2305895 RepID=A0A418MEV4_9BACT|nr:glycosyltransferase family 39 protein [Fibrisoma montanum]RIV25340.1 phospholipid carrier-dependent glycosyltransferase [Fibrisoma montanum]